MKKGSAAYLPTASTSDTFAEGLSSTTNTRMLRKIRKNGVRILPTQVRILPGYSENSSAAAKKATEKSSRYSCILPSAGRICSRPTVKETVAHLGMAKNGPMVRYSAQVKNIA